MVSLFFSGAAHEKVHVGTVSDDGWTAFCVGSTKSVPGKNTPVHFDATSSGLGGGEVHDTPAGGNPRAAAIQNYCANPNQPYVLVVYDPGRQPEPAAVHAAFHEKGLWSTARVIRPNTDGPVVSAA